MSQYFDNMIKRHISKTFMQINEEVIEKVSNEEDSNPDKETPVLLKKLLEQINALEST